MSSSITEDETIAALRRVLGRLFPHNLIQEILGCLLDGVFRAVAGPATGADNRGMALRINALVYRYVAYAAQYWVSLVLGHRDPPPGTGESLTQDA
jgi:hypothetical protein